MLIRILIRLFPVLLSGCTVNFIKAAPEGGAAGGAGTVIEGRINYEVDGQTKAPYGAFRPKWLAPRFSAIRLESRTIFTSPAVDNNNGAFLWALRPGSYVLTKIGTGAFTDDTYIAWPGVILCVPMPAGGPRYAGHLRMLGRSNVELSSLADGKKYRSRALQYTMVVADERAPGGTIAADAPLMHVDRQFPIGDRLVEALATQQMALIKQACP
jgi:hypothetical protein